MQVKKFEAPTMQEALKTIKRELGPDAIILSTKHNKSGFGLMSKASVEITAAIAEKDLKKKQMAEKNLPQEAKEKIWNAKASTQSEIYDNYFEKQLKRAASDRVEITAVKRRTASEQQADAGRQHQHQQPRRQAAEQPPPQRSAPEARRYADITDDDTVAPANTRKVTQQPAYARAAAAESEKVRSLENDIEQLKGMIADLSSSQGARAARPTDDSWETGAMSPEAAQVMQDLVNSGIEKKYARNLVRDTIFDMNPAGQSDEAAVMERVAYQLMQEIQVKDLLEGVGAKAGNARTTVVALVGPTGVGKTTTIAKIASLGILEKRLRVGLINLDSYKVAAADQLSTYAKIMNVPFRSVTSKEELQQAIYDFSSLDLVLIDTTGRSQKDQESLLQLRHVLAGVENVQCALMMSATTKDTDMNDVVSRFKLFNPAGIVFSKLDETSVYGCIYNTQKKTGLPLLYFTVGQRVPEDIEKASAERVVDLVLDL